MLAEFVDLQDVRVGQPGDRLGLALETGQPLRVLRQLFGQHLDGHVPVESLVAGPEHHAHPAGSDLLDDAVVPEGLTSQIRHGCGPLEPSYTSAGSRGPVILIRPGWKAHLDNPTSWDPRTWYRISRLY